MVEREAFKKDEAKVGTSQSRVRSPQVASYNFCSNRIKEEDELASIALVESQSKSCALCKTER